MRAGLIIAAGLILLGCATKPDLSGLPKPVDITPAVAAPAPKPVEQACQTADTWSPGTQEDAAQAVDVLAHMNPNVAHMVREWSRLRDDALACKNAK